jgi:predicted PurR-regulated permease PerM
MGILNKSENWWLRLSLVLFALITLASASVINRNVTSERQTLTDSLNHKNQVIDSLKEEINFKDNQIGLSDMIIEEAKMKNPKIINEILKNTGGFAYEK